MFVLAIPLDAFKKRCWSPFASEVQCAFNSALNQWRNTHSFFQQCTVKESKVFYVLIMGFWCFGFFLGFLFVFLWWCLVCFLGTFCGKGTIKGTYLGACPVLNCQWKTCFQSWKQLVIDNHCVANFCFCCTEFFFYSSW